MAPSALRDMVSHALFLAAIVVDAIVLKVRLEGRCLCPYLCFN